MTDKYSKLVDRIIIERLEDPDDLGIVDLSTLAVAIYQRLEKEPCEELFKMLDNLSMREIDSACYYMSRCYYLGVFVEKDYQKTIYYLELGDYIDDYCCQYRLGRIYFEGEIITKDYQKAFEYFERAAKQGHPESQLALADMYYEGYGVAVDYKKARYWYELAGEQGIGIAYYTIGAMYLKGEGVPMNPDIAAKYQLKALELEYSHDTYFKKYLEE